MTKELTNLNGARLWFAAATKRANDLRAERRDEITRIEAKYAAAIKSADDDVADAFNAAVRAAGPLSWEPDDYAVDLDGGAK